MHLTKALQLVRDLIPLNPWGELQVIATPITAACAIPDDVINCTPPTCMAVHRAIRRLKDGKAPGLCNTTAEMLEAAGPDGVEWLTSICRSAWK